MDLHSHHSVWSSTNGAQPHSAVLPAFCCSAKHQNKKFPKIYLFIYLFLNIIGSVALGVWGLGHGKMTRSITTNHPCLITSAHEKAFPPLRRSPGQSVVGGGGGGGTWMGNKAVELLWTVWFGSTGLRRSSSWNHCLTASWAERNPSLTQA